MNTGCPTQSRYRAMSIGKPLKLSLAFPQTHTVRATFTAYGVPSTKSTLLTSAYSSILITRTSSVVTLLSQWQMILTFTVLLQPTSNSSLLLSTAFLVPYFLALHIFLGASCEPVSLY